jgi:hypothetical protein
VDSIPVLMDLIIEEDCVRAWECAWLSAGRRMARPLVMT